MPKKRGPNTIAGKLRACQNAATHYMTSRQLLVRDERQEDLDAVYLRWHEAYPTNDANAAFLVTRAAQAEWLLFRIERETDQSNLSLFEKSMADWAPADHERYQLNQRYLTSAQRSLDRERRAIQQHRRELRADARELRAVQSAAELATTRGEQKSKAVDNRTTFPANPYEIKDDRLEQRAFIQCENGQTKTILNPPNEFLLRVARCRYDSTEVYRTIVFETSPIPPEYEPFTERAAKLKENQHITLAMTVKSFLLAVQREADGHVKYWPDLDAIDRPILQKKYKAQKKLKT